MKSIPQKVVFVDGLYIDAVIEKHVKEHCNIKPDSEMAKWVKWANEQADRLDPLKESPPSVLDNPPPNSNYSGYYRPYQPVPETWYPGKKWYMK